MELFGIEITRKKKAAQPRRSTAGLTEDQRFLGDDSGFLCYSGGSLLMLPPVAPLVAELEKALGGEPSVWTDLFLPSVRVFAAYAQFLPASEKREGGQPASPGGHHTEPLGLLVHSLQIAIVALNMIRNENVNFGINPEERDRRSSAFMLACGLAGLLHDAGKISDWIVTARGRGGRELEYRFVCSIPEFVADASGVRPEDVLYDPKGGADPSRLPRYYIHGMRPGRGRKHDVIGTAKRDIFVSSGAEKYMAGESQQLYEDFQTFTLQSVLPAVAKNPENIIASVVSKADQASAKWWKDHHEPGAVSPDDAGGFSGFDAGAYVPPEHKDEEAAGKAGEGSPAAEADGEEAASPEAEGQATDEWTDAGDGQQDAAEEAENAQEEQVQGRNEEQAPGLFGDDEEYGGDEAASDGQPEAEPAAENEAEAESEPEPDPEAGAEAESGQDDGAGPALFGDDEEPVVDDQAQALRGALITALHGEVDSLQALIDQDAPNAFLFPFGYEDQAGKRRVALFLRCDASSRDFIVRLIRQASEDLGRNLYEEFSLERTQGLALFMKVAPSCGFTIRARSKDGLYDIWPMALWNARHLDDCPLKAAMLADFTYAYKPGSEIYEAAHAKYSRRGMWFADPAQIAFSISEERLALNSSPRPSIEARMRADENEAAAEAESEAEVARAVQEAVASAGKEEAAEPAQRPASRGAVAERIAAAERKYADRPVEKAAAIMLAVEEDELDAFKKPQLLRGEFRMDREDEDTVKNIMLVQNRYYVSRRELDRMIALPPEEKARQAAELRRRIEKKAETPDFTRKLMRELSICIKGGNSYIALKNLNGDNIYAAFLWDSRSKSAKKSKGTSLLEHLIDRKLVPLATGKDDWFNTSDELDYFSCVMLDPIITSYLILSGDPMQYMEKVEIRQWSNPSRPPTAAEVIRYFEHYVIQSGPGQPVFGYMPEGSNALQGIKIDHRALKACAEALNSRGSATVERRVLSLKDQVTPPYIWKEGRNYVICFFSKVDPRYPCHERVAAEDRRNDMKLAARQEGRQDAECAGNEAEETRE